MSGSVSDWVGRAVVVGFISLSVLQILGVLAVLAVELLGLSGPSVLLALGLSVAVSVYVGVGLAPGKRSDSAGSGSVWEGIPTEQYTGRLAESGGITRLEQERELDRLRNAEPTDEQSRDDEH